MLKALQRVFEPDPVAQVIECRRCGTTLNRPTASCPVCGSYEIARYEW